MSMRISELNARQIAKKYKFTRIKVEPFGWSVMLTSDMESVRQYFKDTGTPDEYIPDEKCIGGFTAPPDAFLVMTLPAVYSEETIWHEALHVTMYMWDYAGAQLDPHHNDEVYTYTQGHIVRLINKCFYHREVT